MKKIFVIILIFGIGAIVFWFYEQRKIAELVEARSLFWRVSIDNAREAELTSDQFIAKYGHEAQKVTKIGQMVQMQDAKAIKSFTCSQYTYEIVYSFDPSGGSNLTRVSGGCY